MKGIVYTANLFTAKTAGFHCVRFLTVVSLYFLQSSSACSGSLQSNCKVAQSFIFCSLMTAIFKVWCLLAVLHKTYNCKVYFCRLVQTVFTNEWEQKYTNFQSLISLTLQRSFYSLTLTLSRVRSGITLWSKGGALWPGWILAILNLSVGILKPKIDFHLNLLIFCCP